MPSNDSDRAAGAALTGTPAAATAPEQRRPATIGPKARKMNAERLESAALAARILSSAIVASGASLRAVAFALGLESHSPVGNWTDQAHGAAISLRDLIALRRAWPSLYAEVVRQLVDAAPQPARARLCVTRHALLVGSEAGDVAREAAAATADGKLEPAERARLRRELVEVIEASRRALADLDERDAP